MTTATQKHIGRNISRIREIKGMKQTTLAELLGISQQQVSIIENSESVEETKLESIAKILEVPIEVIKEYSDDKVMNIITNNTFQDDSSAIKNLYNPTFNPLDKLVEAYEENKKLYERLLEAEKEKIAYLEKLLSSK
ncbi:transcriptional regulator with XRE-family HTH domain [Myroides gitamensis]|uniref:helix-turn-helix domain-containing protein n=1 Tax=Myroides odoratus TaxID=256 RepID=UPI002168A37B|nr:helix-turn-helix transcriptional regulator [Myroides odoratus]MCS4237961.1 transcriptional regulator with XRE-family HTH domain [Myroides odoratus]MDH6600035.1 transcriptional regulator with XRE-family HTH domain [Myroides gitamensis]